MERLTMEFPTIDPKELDKAWQMPPDPGADKIAQAQQPAGEDVAEIRDGRAIVHLSRTAAGLAQLKADLGGKVYDLTTTKGNEEARADRLRCVKLRTGLEAKRKALKAPAVEFGRLIDAEAKRITSEIEAMEAPIDAAIKADEARREKERQERELAERERKAKLQAGVTTLLNYITQARAPGMTAERLAKGMEALRAMQFGDEWQEYRQQAEDARAEALAALTEAHAGAVEREEQAKRQAEEAARLKAEAEELARLRAQAEADRAEIERQRRELQAAQDDQKPAQDSQRQESGAQTDPNATGNGNMAHNTADSAPGGGQAEGEVVSATSPGSTTTRTDEGPPALPPSGGVEAAAPAMCKCGARELTACPGEWEMGCDLGANEQHAQVVQAMPTADLPTMKLGDINDRLKPLKVDAAGLSALGIVPAGTKGAAALYRASDWSAIKAAIVNHIKGLA